jgi:hypothetical protein
MLDPPGRAVQPQVELAMGPCFRVRVWQLGAELDGKDAANTERGTPRG